MKYSGLFLVACVALFASSDAATLIKSSSANRIPGSYIVVLRDGTTVSDFVPKFKDMAKQNSRGRGSESTITRQYDSMRAFSGSFNDADLKELLASDDVDYVEEDQIMSINVMQQNNPPSWGLRRVSQRAPKSAPYYYQNQAGSGVTAYVIDTGINTAHAEFGGRATMGATFIAGEANTDMNGHGTHVAGTIGGSKYGVAKKVKLVGIKVLNAQGSGSNAGVLSGLEWVLKNYTPGSKAVVNMSLGGGKSPVIDQAITNLYNAGIPVFVAAGNNPNVDACYGSPSGAPDAFTVAASDINDIMATFSSWGTCVDIFGPGVAITSAWLGSSTATNIISGTSMATPHVAGVAALLMSSDFSLKTPKAVYDKLIQTSTKNIITGLLRGSVNRLVFNNAI